MAGNFSRRTLLSTGLTGFSAMTLPTLLRARAESVTPPSEKTAIILVWLRGGCSHLDTFDPKPLASTDYRGPFSTIPTATPGMYVTELIPRLARIADRFTLVRSMEHTGGGHPAGSLQILGGDRDAQDKRFPNFPDWMSVVNHFRRDPKRSIPAYVAVNPVDTYDSFTIAGPTYLGPACEPFRVIGDPSRPEFVVPNVGISNAEQRLRLERMNSLRRTLDRFNAKMDLSGQMQAVDSFDLQAMNLLTDAAACKPFDLNLEPLSVRQRYGMNAWGQQCLMARRLVEAGVDVVSTEFDGPLCGRVANWDDHAVNHHVFDALSFRAPVFDQAVSALIEDVYDRGLDRRVLVVVMGEFGRTPRISYVASSGGGVASAPEGTVQPGRDHWPAANTILFAGGGIRTGQIIGSTDPRGEHVVEKKVHPDDLLATIYRHLGIDYQSITLPNFRGRPTPIVQNGAPIPGLIS